MPGRPHVRVQVDLSRVARNAQQIAHLVNVPILAVVKADAYGLGAHRIARTIDDVVGGFCVFSVAEAVDAEISSLVKKTIILAPFPDENVETLVQHGARPAVWETETASRWQRARPVLSVDTGMQRFACPAERIDDVIRAGGCDEAFTHAIRMEQVDRLKQLVGGRGLKLHAAGSSLLHEPAARFDAVRPGLALYRSAVRVVAPLIDARDSRGPLGYRGVISATGRHGVIPAGYSHGLRPGPCLINGRRQVLLESGMQSSYVQLDARDTIGDEVILLGDGLGEDDVARAWASTPHEALLRLARSGVREYLS